VGKYSDVVVKNVWIEPTGNLTHGSKTVFQRKQDYAERKDCVVEYKGGEIVRVWAGDPYPDNDLSNPDFSVPLIWCKEGINVGDWQLVDKRRAKSRSVTDFDTPEAFFEHYGIDIKLVTATALLSPDMVPSLVAGILEGKGVVIPAEVIDRYVGGFIHSLDEEEGLVDSEIDPIHHMSATVDMKEGAIPVTDGKIRELVKEQGRRHKEFELASEENQLRILNEMYQVLKPDDRETYLRLFADQGVELIVEGSEIVSWRQVEGDKEVEFGHIGGEILELVTEYNYLEGRYPLSEITISSLDAALLGIRLKEISGVDFDLDKFIEILVHPDINNRDIVFRLLDNDAFTLEFMDSAYSTVSEAQKNVHILNANAVTTKAVLSFLGVIQKEIAKHDADREPVLDVPEELQKRFERYKASMAIHKAA